MRSYHKLWRIALTLADLEWVQKNPDMAERRDRKDELRICEHHVLDALSFRATHWGHD